MLEPPRATWINQGSQRLDRRQGRGRSRRQWSRSPPRTPKGERCPVVGDTAPTHPAARPWLNLCPRQNGSAGLLPDPPGKPTGLRGEKNPDPTRGWLWLQEGKSQMLLTVIAALHQPLSSRFSSFLRCANKFSPDANFSFFPNSASVQLPRNRWEEKNNHGRIWNPILHRRNFPGFRIER